MKTDNESFNLGFNWYDEPVCALDPLLFIPRIEYAEQILCIVKSRGIPQTLVILDMKNFHQINDIFDYSTGDRVLREFVLLLRNKLPPGSISMRFRHGDEFLFFLSLDIKSSKKLFSNFNAFCFSHSFLKSPGGKNIDISFRFACKNINMKRHTADVLLMEAEAELRKVKGKGTQRKN